VLKKNSWDDIPSLDDLAVEWDYKSPAEAENRSFVRLNMQSLSQLFGTKEILAKFVTTTTTCECRLVDLCRGGVAIKLSSLIDVQETIKVGFFLGANKILAKGVVRHRREERDGYIYGIQFTALSPGADEYIDGLYASKVLYKVGH
jgi:c-di-GMP-binding flagellar brake protein YcgR